MNRLQQLAKNAIAAVDGDDRAAVKAIIQRKVALDPTLRDLLVDYAIDEIISNQWRAARAVRRNSDDFTIEIDPTYQRPSFGPTPPNDALLRGIQVGVNDLKTRLMDWEMRAKSGKRLGNCTKPELEEYAVMLKKNSVTLDIDSAWLLAVAGMLPDNKQLVKHVLREEDLTRLRRRIERQKAA